MASTFPAAVLKSVSLARIEAYLRERGWTELPSPPEDEPAPRWRDWQRGNRRVGTPRRALRDHVVRVHCFIEEMADLERRSLVEVYEDLLRQRVESPPRH